MSFYEQGQHAALEKLGFTRQVTPIAEAGLERLRNLLGMSSRLSRAADLQRRLQGQIRRAVPTERASLQAEAAREAKDYLRGMQELR
jgi:hypothetical protein